MSDLPKEEIPSGQTPPRQYTPLPPPIRPLSGSNYPRIDPETQARCEQERRVEQQREREHAEVSTKNAEAAWEMEKAHQYMWRGEQLREARRILRQEQYCELCGYRFNCDVHGTLKHPNDWCRPDKILCDEKNGDDFCLARQKSQKTYRQRAQKKTVSQEATISKASSKNADIN